MLKPKIRLTLTNVLLAIPLFILAQDPTEIIQIRKDYASIENNLDNQQIISLSNWYYEGKNMEITAYRDKITHEVVKLEIERMGDWFESKNNYYLKNRELFFLYINGNSGTDFKTPEEMDINPLNYDPGLLDPKKLVYFEYRFYYNNKECIRYLIKEKTINYNPEKNETTQVDFSSIQNVQKDPKQVSYARDYELVDMILKEIYGSEY